MLAQLPHHMMWRSRLSCGSSAARTGLGAPRLPTLPAPSARRPLTNYRVRHASSDAAVTTIGPAEALLSACRSRCSYFVHFGNCIVLLAINQTDMMHLRGLSIGASCCGIAYNMLQPNPLVAPALWGVFFIGCHTYQISILLREQQEVRLSDDEEAAYQRAFVRFGFTPRQFLDILEAAQPPPPAEGGAFATHGHGATIHARGSPMDTISFVLEGEVEMVSTTDDGMSTVHPGKGGWLGEFYDPNIPSDYWEKPHTHPISYRCVDRAGCRTFQLARQAMHETIAANPRLHAMATRAEVDDLWGKLHRAPANLRRRSYQAMLEVAVSDGEVSASERRLLDEFRERHGVEEAEHSKYLEQLGWTEAEFAAGAQQQQSQQHQPEQQHKS